MKAPAVRDGTQILYESRNRLLERLSRLEPGYQVKFANALAKLPVLDLRQVVVFAEALAEAVDAGLG